MVQGEFKVGFEGIAGSHSEDALMQLFHSQSHFKNKLKESKPFVCEAVKNGSIDLGIVPIENSIAGTFFGVLDLLSKYDLHIVGEYEHEEKQCLVGWSGATLSSLVEIHSHPYAFDQCRPFLGTLTGKKLVQSLDTAFSCKHIQESKSNTVAAIASERAAKMYGLQVLEVIGSPAVTRYALVSKTPITPERHLLPRTSLEVVLKNQIGAFAKAITVFSHRDINISKIESRPSSRSIRLQKPWEYSVYIDVDCGTSDDRMGKAIANLQEFGQVRVLGSYPRYQQPIEDLAGVYSFGV
ncbi:hypothetical protein HDV02_004590 [Globomyces sp. JEL0801]|nr:hypothetical protein HDV02_004590 [Globomyces sp. JEL0801]